MKLTFGFEQALSRLQSVPDRYRQAGNEGLRDAALIVERRTKEILAQGGEGRNWPPLAASTMRNRPAAALPLNVTGDLMRRVSHEVDTDEQKAFVGWMVEYGPVHEYGTTRAGKGRKTVIPARPHMTPAAEESMKDIGKAFRERVRQALKG